MGAAASTNNGIEVELTSEQQIQRMLNTFENYDAKATITKEELAIAESGWTCVINDLSPEYIRKREDKEPNLPHSCLSWFYDTFFLLAMEYDENIKESYNNNMKVQIRAMISMISSSLSILRGNDVIRTHSILKVAKIHYQRGIRSHQYPIVANVCVKTFVLCMGKYWKDKLESAWTKIFSIILTKLVPSAFRFEKGSTPTSTTSSSGERSPTKFRSSSDVDDKIRSDAESDILRMTSFEADSDCLKSIAASELFELSDKVPSVV